LGSVLRHVYGRRNKNVESAITVLHFETAN